jgi:hypothetical protein
MLDPWEEALYFLCVFGFLILLLVAIARLPPARWTRSQLAAAVNTHIAPRVRALLHSLNGYRI